MKHKASRATAGFSESSGFLGYRGFRVSGYIHIHTYIYILNVYIYIHIYICID